MSSQAQLYLRALARPQLSWQGVELEAGSQKALAIICYAGLAPAAIPRSELRELLWQADKKAGSNLRVELARLRKLPGAESWLELLNGVAVAAASDVDDFTKLVKTGRFAAALELWDAQTAFLHGLEPRNAPAFLEWKVVEHTRLETLYRDALLAHAQNLVAQRDLADAAPLLKRALELDPLDESVYRSLMRLSSEQGHSHAALAYFDACRAALADALSITPSAETTDLANSIQQGLEMTAGTATPDSATAVATPGRIPLTVLRPPVLAGRAAALASMEAAWAAGKVIYILGEAGMGKTRLMMDFVEAQTKGNYYAAAARPLDKYQSFITLARSFRPHFQAHSELMDELEPWVCEALAQVMPDVFGVSASAAEDETISAAFFEVYAQCSRHYGALCADDLHFFDSESLLESGRALARLHLEQPDITRFIVALRPSEAPEFLVAGLRQMSETGEVAVIDLEPLDRQAIEVLLAGLELSSPELADYLAQATGGNPLYITELLRALYSARDADGFKLDRLELPQRVSDIIVRRLARLPKAAQQVAQVLATVQAHVTLELLETLLDMNTLELAEHLSTLEKAQVIRGLSFAHDLLYETVRLSTPKVVRQRLHARVAELLSTTAEADLVAYHEREAALSS